MSSFSAGFSETYNLSSFNNTQQSGQLHKEMPPAFLIFKATAFCVITIFNIFANSLTLVVLRKLKDFSPVTKVFMTSMTIADLGAVFVITPIVVATAVNRWPFGLALCTMHGFVFTVFAYTSVFSLFCVTSERYLAVTKPFQYPTLVTVQRARLISLCVWVCGLAVATSISFMPGRVIYYSQSWHACITGPKDPSVVDVHEISTVLFLACVPFGLTLVMFLRLFLLARFHAAKITAQESQIGRNSDKKAFTTFLIMTTCLVIGWTPFMALIIYESILPEKEVSLWLVCLTQLTASSNGVNNVVVYYLRNTAFRQAAKKLLVARIWEENNRGNRSDPLTLV